MEQRIVSQEENRYVYFIQENNVGFYLMIPRSSEVSLVLNVIDNISDDVIKNLQFPKSQVYVCPVVSSEVLSSVLQNQSDSYQFMDVIFSRALNLAHQILTYNHVNVNNSVYLKNNTKYAMFCSWFLKKYEGRVFLLEDEKPTVDEVMNTAVTSSVVEDPVSVPQNQNVNSVSESEPLATNDVSTIEDVQVNSSNHGSLGFVSYVLLGVVVAVLSLVFLYFIL